MPWWPLVVTRALSPDGVPAFDSPAGRHSRPPTTLRKGRAMPIRDEHPPEPVMVTLIHMDTYKMGGYDDAADIFVSVALVIPEGGTTPCMHIVDPEDVSTFQALLDSTAETFVSSAEIFPYHWYQLLLERPVGPVEWLERVT